MNCFHKTDIFEATEPILNPDFPGLEFSCKFHDMNVYSSSSDYLGGSTFFDFDNLLETSQNIKIYSYNNSTNPETCTYNQDKPNLTTPVIIEGEYLKQCIHNLELDHDIEQQFTLNSPEASPFQYKPKQIKKKTDKKFKIKHEIIQSNSRKFKPDGMRKKFKVNHLKYFKNKINEMLKKHKSRNILMKLNKCFTSAINISHNKNVLEMTMYDIYKKDLQLEPMKNARDRSRWNRNKETIKEILNIDEIFMEMKKTYKESIKEYLQTKDFENHIMGVEKKEPKEYTQFYKNICDDYIMYYLKQNPNKHRRKK
jgi:hypothetical protein